MPLTSDVLQSDDQELLAKPFANRDGLPEALFANRRTGTALGAVPATTVPTILWKRLHEWTDVPGVEGVIAERA